MTTLNALSTPDNSSVWREQFRMTHTFHLLSGGQPIAGLLEATFQGARAHIEKWVIARRGGGYEHSITVQGIGDDSARELRRELARLDGDIKVQVEHMLHFDRAALPR